MNLYRKYRKLLWRISMRGLPRGAHITRYYMYEKLKLIGSKLPNTGGRVLSISHSSNLIELMGLQPGEVVLADYPEQNILSLGFPDSCFDYVLADQVLEHVEGDPQQAVDECYRVLKPGGISVITTCFIYYLHPNPSDFWRFTPEALALLHRQWSETIDVDGWGNFQVWSIIAPDGLLMTGVPHAKWHPLHKLAVRKDSRWPISTWIVAKK